MREVPGGEGEEKGTGDGSSWMHSNYFSSPSFLPPPGPAAQYPGAGALPSDTGHRLPPLPPPAPALSPSLPLQGRLLNTPELVPFRLTRDIVDGMGVAGTEGVMRRSCEACMQVLRDSKDSLLTVRGGRYKDRGGDAAQL